VATVSWPATVLHITVQEVDVLNRWTRRLTAGALSLVLGSGAALEAQTQPGVRVERSSDSETSAIVVTRHDPEVRPRPVREWKIDDISRARWHVEDPKGTSAPHQQAKKKSHRGLAVMLIAIGGAVAGGYFGSVVQGSLCECDDQRTVGAAYGALFGGAIAGIVSYSVLR
jgi:hypothetical protein